ncbi:hypothetical protein NESM_000691300 [Novymonas esmeraldas]|uniref:Uncharacterized protein n=1 Tax=Novymonas esmeraldas TaxID=1808958 RepID=A0AAW0ETE5_9TRYP
MNTPLSHLVRRLAAPAVATALTKEELCLALAAIAQLQPVTASATHSREGAAALPTTDALARRSIRLLPRCSPQEVGMIARGAGALRWSSAPSLPITDTLTRNLYMHVTRGSEPAGAVRVRVQVRLGDVLAVVQHAIEARRYFDSTVAALATQHAVEIGAQLSSLSSAAAEEFVAVVCGYVGEEDGVVAAQQLAARLEEASPPATRAGLAVLRGCARRQPLPLSQKWAAVYARWAQQRRDVLQQLEEGSEVAGALSTRRTVWRVVRDLRAADDIPDEDAVLHEALKCTSVLRISDPVTLSTLDEAVARRIGAPSLSSAALTAFENSVYVQALHLPRALAALRARDAGAAASPAAAGEALQRVSTIQRVYADVVAGRCVTEKDLFQLNTDVDTSSADEVAMIVFVLTRVKEVPPSLMMLLTKHAKALSLAGVAALIRAGRHDRRGALTTVLLTCLEEHARMQECVAAATTATLVELANALSLPCSRWTAAAGQLRLVEAQLVDMVVARFLSEVEQMPLQALLTVMSIDRGGLALMGDLATAVYSRVGDLLSSTSAPPAMSLCVEVLASLQRCGDLIPERLTDVLAAALAARVRELAQPHAQADASDLVGLTRFASLQAEYGAPALGAVSTGLALQVRQGDWEALPAETLVAAALATFDRSSNLKRAVVSGLPYAVVGHFAAAAERVTSAMTTELAVAVLELLTRLRVGGEDAHAKTLLACVLPVASRLQASAAAQLLCLHHRGAAAKGETTAAAVPAQVYSAVGDNALGLSADTFTALCSVAAQPGFDSALANRLVDVLPLVADGLSAHQLCRCVFGLGEMVDAGRRLSHQVMTEVLSDYAVDNVELFTSGPDIAALLHGFAKLQCTKRNLYSVFSVQLLRRPVLSTLSFQAVSQLFFAFGAVKFMNKDLLDRLTAVFISHVHELAAPDLFLTMRGLSRLSLLNDVLYYKLGLRATELLDEFPLKTQCELLHAYAAVEECHPILALALVQRIAASVEALPSASAATEVLASLWLTGFDMASEDVHTIVRHVERNASQLTGRDILKLCSITLQQRWEHPKLLQAMATRAVAMHTDEALEADVARAVLDTLSSQFVFHQAAREHLSSLARSVSKDVVLLSGEEQEQLSMLTSH